MGQSEHCTLYTVEKRWGSQSIVHYIHVEKRWGSQSSVRYIHVEKRSVRALYIIYSREEASQSVVHYIHVEKR